MSGTNIIVHKTDTKIVTVRTPGPQGPAFVGTPIFDNDVINALGQSDEGKVLAWDGSLFQPVSELTKNLTLSGGAF